MKFIVFILTYPFIWIISRFPMRILYIISDFFFIILYYILGYRKKVVLENLKLAFPNKTDKEHKIIAKKFFKHFTDIIFESVKSFSISEEEIKKRYTYKNVEIFNSIKDRNKSVILTGAHYGNWEWIIYLNRYVDFAPYAAYTKIQNKYFEKKMLKSRTKFGANFIRTSNIIKTIETNKKANKKSIYGLLSDQSPQLHKTFYWTEFLGVKVPVITGPEMLAKKYDLTIINFKTTRVKRGYYESEFELITEDASSFKDYEITDKYLKITEAHIAKQPEFYLWSHKRFKHKDKYEEWLHNIAKKRA